MPIYEYKRADGSTFEVIQKFTDDALTKDPETGEPVERVYTAPAIHFKGSGFHNTDYGSSRRPKAGSGGESSADTSSSSSSDSSASSKSEAKKSDSSKPEKKSGDTGPAKKAE